MTYSNDSRGSDHDHRSARNQSPRPSPRRRGTGNDPKKNLPGPPTRPLRTLAFWVVLFLLAIVIFQVAETGRPSEHEVSYSVFHDQMVAGNILSMEKSGRQAAGEFREQVVTRDVRGQQAEIQHYKVQLPFEDLDQDYYALLLEKNPGLDFKERPERFDWWQMTIAWLPILLIVAFWLFVIRQIQSGGSTALKFGKSKAKVLMQDHPKVTFDDVAGADEAKEELQEIIDFLREPKKFQLLGGRIPKGGLLLGPPGTGKTLLARAVAGEAGVPFFSMSGSDFVEMFVGVGASRVRDLFEQGKKNAPCIIFIDEIDAVGRHRGAGLGGGHDEREQTLNQLLVEMDGFESNEGVILIAATNRPDVLDPALLRPGRFDRQIVVDFPDSNGREGILRVHARDIPLDDTVELGTVARGTPGLAGADLANIVNEAALLAARRNHLKVTMRDFEDAKDKVMLGTERRSLVISEKEKRTTAFHEAGHALVAWLQPGTDPIHKATIIPRGRALGLVYQLPEDDRFAENKDNLLARLAILMGGRASEKLIFDRITSGASNDIRTATEIARKMVCEWGMSDDMGPIAFGKREEMVFLGKEISQQKDYSEETAQRIDQEVRKLVEDAETRAVTLLQDNMDKLNLLAETLLKREVMDGDEIDRLLKGEEIDPVESPAPESVTEDADETEQKPDIAAQEDLGTGFGRPKRLPPDPASGSAPA
jgi:cell division protease FtsH